MELTLDLVITVLTPVWNIDESFVSKTKIIGIIFIKELILIKITREFTFIRLLEYNIQYYFSVKFPFKLLLVWMPPRV